MALADLGLSFGMNQVYGGTPYVGDGSGGVLIHEDQDEAWGSRDIRLIWSSYDSGQHEYWNFTITAYGIGSYSNATSGSSYVSLGTFHQQVPVAQCNLLEPDGPDGRAWWSHNLAIDGLLNSINNGRTAWSFAQRQWDSIKLEVKVWSTFYEWYTLNGSTVSDTATGTFFIAYCPIYTLTGVEYITGGYMRIHYSANWGRKDDTFYLVQSDYVEEGPCLIQQDDSTYARMFPTSIRGEVGGTTTYNGACDVPVSLMTMSPVGRQVFVNVQFQPSYRSAETTEFARASGYFLVESNAECGPVSIQVISTSPVVRIRVTSAATGDQEVPTSATVHVVGYTSSLDTVEVEVPGEVSLPYLPDGEQVTIEATGMGSNGAVSGEVARVTVSTPSSGHAMVIAFPETGQAINLEYMTSGGLPSVSISPNYDSVQLAGRQYPTIGFTSGLNKTFSAQGVALFTDALDIESMAGSMSTMVVKLRDGRRYYVVGTIKLTKKGEVGAGGIWYVNVSGTVIG